MRSSLTIPALAVYATSVLAYVADVFTCIDPQAHCCTMLTSSRIGVNCQPAPLVVAPKLYGENTTRSESHASDGGSQFVSLCYKTTEASPNSPQIPACCKTESAFATPNMMIFECIPPEETLYRFYSDTEDWIRYGGDEWSKNQSDDNSDRFDDDDYYLYE